MKPEPKIGETVETSVRKRLIAWFPFVALGVGIAIAWTVASSGHLSLGTLIATLLLLGSVIGFIVIGKDAAARSVVGYVCLMVLIVGGAVLGLVMYMMRNFH